MRTVAIVGAGFSGAVVAQQLAEHGYSVEIFEARNHVAGNCHTARHSTGVLMHVYGPHIFHTSSKKVWDYVGKFASMRPYRHRVIARVKDRLFSLPINLLTINQFFNTTLSPNEARAFVASRCDTSIAEAKTVVEQGLRSVGRELYEAFFAGYTAKQWGREPAQLPASVLKRLPVRFNYDDSYFQDPYQGLPELGYTAIVERLLDHPRISVHLEYPFGSTETDAFDHVFWTGPIDAFFDKALGPLPYRTLEFHEEVYDGDYQGCPVMNYCDADVPFTRATEHKHLSPWEEHEKTVVYLEFSRECGLGDTPYYPIRLAGEIEQLAAYVHLTQSLRGVSFIGRLGTYRYLDMDAAIREALEAAHSFLTHDGDGTVPPAFFTDPIA